MLTLAGCVSSPRSYTFTLGGSAGTSFTCAVPVSIEVDLAKLGSEASQTAAFQVVEMIEGRRSREIEAQFAPASDLSRATVSWLLPPGSAEPRTFVLKPSKVPGVTSLQAEQDRKTGRWDIREDGRLVLSYNYLTNHPGEILAKIHTNNLKYARPRGNYIHPLCGPEGEVMTKDWSIDHPHHRGIYWAWPEVDYRGERGDLHALQRVFARPIGNCVGQSGPVFAQVDGESLWLWEDREPIVRERAVIRVWRGEAIGRFVDLEFRFTALKDDVAIARRDTKLYGGFNMRLAPVQDQQIELHTTPATASQRKAWADLSGIFPSGKAPVGLAVFQHPANPDYPGDWVKYPELNWFQPTFPAAGTRYILKRDQPLTLRYRLWIHRGKSLEAKLASDLWSAFVNPPSAIPTQSKSAL